MMVIVASADIDRLGHVNNAVYLRWVEAAVHGHWLHHALDDERQRIDWIAVRHEIDYRLPAFAGDRLRVGVVIEQVRRARAWYRTTITRGPDTIVDALSCWCAIDPASRRLTVIPDSVASRFLPTGTVPDQDRIEIKLDV